MKDEPMSNPVLKVDVDGPIATLTMNRPDKRNAMCEELLNAIDAFFSAPPKDVRVVILTGTAGHFCSGLDLSEHVHRTPEENLYHSRAWHAVMEKIQFGGLVVVSAMFGAVIGGGLEIAASTHVRIAEPSTIFQLPEGRRGIFVGGGATARVGRILGPDRMTEMMLTGRKFITLWCRRLHGLVTCHIAMVCSLNRWSRLCRKQRRMPRKALRLSWKNARQSSGDMMAKADKHPKSAPKVQVNDETLQRFLGYHLKRGFNVVQTDLGKTLKPFDLRMLTYSALVLIADNPGLSQSQLADAMDIERPNLVVIVDELEQRELISRERVPTDRRAYALQVTLKGKRLCERAVTAVSSHEEALFAGIDTQTRASIVTALQLIQQRGAKRNL